MPTGNIDLGNVELEYQRPYLYPKQFAAIFEEKRYSLVEASAQPLDTLVQTPQGPVRFGDLRIGSPVFSMDGTVTTVTGIFPQGVQCVFRLTFSDGTETRASGDHLWQIEHPRGRRILTTDRLRSYAPNSLRLISFPLCDPVQYPHTPVAIDPWLLGVLIGDGSLCGNALTVATADPEIVERVRAVIPSGYEVKRGAEYSWRIVARARGAGYERPAIRFKAGGYEVQVGKKYVGRRWTWEEAIALHSQEMLTRYGADAITTNLRVELRKLGLLGLQHNEKFVPPIYLYNDVETRLEILRGVMDTDGSAGQGNGAVIEQTSPRLASNILELVRSLGGVARLAEHPPRRAGYKTSYRINMRHADITSFFWLPRKKYSARSQTLGVRRKLISVQEINPSPVQCISVAHDSNLYLTDQFLVTHNTKAGKTSGCIAWIVEQALQGQPGHNFWWVAPVSDQALIAFRRSMRAIPQWLYTPNISLKTITLVNGAVIWFKSGDKPNSLYGEDVYAAVLDEASRMKEDAYIAIRSTLTFTRGKVRIIGNVRGRKNWFFRLARRAEHENDAEMAFHKIVASDAVKAGVLDAKEIEDARSQLPENAFRELYLAEASDDGGNPFGLAHILGCIVPSLSPRVPAVWGWDFAKRQDYTVGVALDQFGYVCRFERFHGIPWPEIMGRVIRATGSTPALCDSTGVGDPILDQLQRTPGSRFEGYHFTQASKQRLMEGLAVAIQSRAVTYPDGPIKLELEQFEFEYSRTGVRYSAPPGFFDDCVCALALAVMHKQMGPRPLMITPDMVQQVIAAGRQSARR